MTAPAGAVPKTGHDPDPAAAAAAGPPARAAFASRSSAHDQGPRRSGPVQFMPVAVAFVLAANILCFWIALSQPYVGAHFAPAPDTPGIRVSAVDAGGPFDRAGLVPGDILTHADSAAAPSLALDPDLGLPDPDFAATQAAVMALPRDSGRLHPHLASGEVRFTLADGRAVTVRPGEGRALLSLLTDDGFLPPIIFGNLAFAIGFLIWVYARRQVIPHLLLLAGTTNALMMWTAAVMWSRELALPEATFRLIFAVNQFGALFYPTALFCLLLVYPTQLVRWRALRWPLMLAGVLWLHAVFPLIELPFRWFFVFVIAISLATLPTMAAQWTATRKQPVERAQASLLAFSCLILSLGVVAIYVLPILFTGQSFGGTLSLSGLMTILPFFGFAIGVARYRLFDLPTWWFTVSVWFISGLLILAVELSIFFFLGARHITSLAIATLAVGWIYFPLRQFLFDRIFRARHYALPDILPAYLKRLSEARSASEFDENLKAESVRLFAPAAIAGIRHPTSNVRIEESGLVLIVPAATPGFAFRLEGAASATRLFNRRDVTLAETIVDLTRRYRTQIEAIETSVGAERRRIARDLHDTVGAKMVSLIHGAPDRDVARKARDACRALIDTIWLLRSDEDQPLSVALSKWAEEARERAEDASIELAWRHGDMRQIRLPAQTIVNVGNILREAMSNTIRHSRARQIDVNIDRLQGDTLLLEVCHDGAPLAPSQWRRGFGLQGIDERVSEMGGDVEWAAAPDLDGGVVMRVSVPVRRAAGGEGA